MIDLPQALTIGELVARDFRAAAVLRKHGIDYCCGGKRNWREVCAEHGLDPHQLAEEIDQRLANGPREHDFASWSSAFLADYIEQTHHRYLRDNLPTILDLAHKVAGKHAQRFPETTAILACIQQLAHELLPHLEQEETTLFPAIRALDLPGAAPDNWHSLLSQLADEHAAAGLLLDQLSALTHTYQAPAGACHSHQALNALLAELDQDLRQHVHLENNILFERLAALPHGSTDTL